MLLIVIIRRHFNKICRIYELLTYKANILTKTLIIRRIERNNNFLL